MDKLNKNCIIKGKIIHKTSNMNELILKYKIKGEENESNILFDKNSNTFCHIISDIIRDSKINDMDTWKGDNDDIKENILIPRRVVFIIDRSASMSGIKWKNTILSTITTLKQLRINYDRYCITFFDHNITLETNSLILTNNKSISNSIKYLKSKSIGGATNVNDSLLKGTKLIKDDIKLLNQTNNNDNDNYNFYMNQIIFIQMVNQIVVNVIQIK